LPKTRTDRPGYGTRNASIGLVRAARTDGKSPPITATRGWASVPASVPKSTSSVPQISVAHDIMAIEHALSLLDLRS
jgi:hypothetical protein